MRAECPKVGAIKCPLNQMCVANITKNQCVTKRSRTEMVSHRPLQLNRLVEAFVRIEGNDQ
jgi:hypothetical protein